MSAEPEITPEEKDREKQVQDLMRRLNREQGGDEFFRRMYGKNQEDLESASQVSEKEHKRIAGMLWFAQEFEQPWLAEFVRRDLSIRRSIDRKGRKEAVDSMIGRQEQKARSLLSLRRITG